MPTDPSKINVSRILHISDDEQSTGVDELMTAHAVSILKENAYGTPPTIIEFTNADLVDGEFTYAYESQVPVVYLVLVDNDNNEVKVSPYFDPDGMYFSIDLNTVLPLTGTWTVSVWMASGPHPFLSDLEEGSAADFIRAWGDMFLDLKTIGEYTGLSLYTPPAGRQFLCRDLNIIVYGAVGVTVPPKLTLDYMGGYALIDDVDMLATLPNQRYNYNLQANGDILVPSNKLIRVRVSTAGVAAGAYTAKVNIAGYLL